MSHHLFLLRHGTSTGNEEAVRQGLLDYPLSAEGEAQIKTLAAHWQGCRMVFDEIVTSPLSRARRSAEILAEGLSSKLSEEPLWIERDAGQAQGQSLDAGNAFYAHGERPHAYQPLFGDGESLTQLHMRAAAGLEAMLSRPPGTYLVVAHGGILAAAVRAALGLQPTAWNVPVHIRFDNAAYAELVLDDQHNSWSLMHVNASAPPITPAE